MAPCYVFAETLPKPIFKTSQPERKKVIEEGVYYFKVMEYVPPVKIELIKKQSKAKYNNPENAVISFLSAMFAKDFLWWRNSWSEDSQKEMQERDKALKRSPDFWTKAWEKSIKKQEG